MFDPRAWRPAWCPAPHELSSLSGEDRAPRLRRCPAPRRLLAKDFIVRPVQPKWKVH